MKPRQKRFVFVVVAVLHWLCGRLGVKRIDECQPVFHPDPVLTMKPRTGAASASAVWSGRQREAQSDGLTVKL